MTGQTIRFGTDQWELVQHAAKITGAGTAQFIRESSFARAVAVTIVREIHEPDSENLAVMKLRLTALLNQHPDLRDRILAELDLLWT